jgi:hypothetical protein
MSDAHVDEATSIFEEYSFILSLDNWATGDLVHLSQLIDTELQIRADNPKELENQENEYEEGGPPWSEET